MKTVEAEKQLDDAAAGLRQEWSNLNKAAGPGPVLSVIEGSVFLGKVTALAYRAASLKVRTWRQFLRHLRMRRLLKDVDLEALPAAELALVQKAFERGVKLSDKARVKIPQDEPIPVDPRSPKGQRRRDVGDVDPPAPGTAAQVLGGADPRTAGRGGIERIERSISPGNENVVVIEGRLLQPIKGRAKNAPNYNREPEWTVLREEHGLQGWEAAHLWGPGFGDEAAAGIFLAHRSINQIWQNQGVEEYLRQLRRLAARRGGVIRVRATATSYERTAYGGAALKDVKYEFSIVTRGNAKQLGKVEVSAGRPPRGEVTEPKVTKLSEDDL